MADWKREFDRWVVATDKSTVVLEEAASQLVQSERKEGSLNIGADMACGEYIGMCYAMAVLSGVPFNTVKKVVQRMAGVEEESHD